jgi:hypothetical protein
VAGVLFGRPFAFREGLLIWPWTFFLFTWSAAAYGPCFTLLITWITEKVTKKKLVKDNVIDLLAKISGWMIFTYIIAKIMRHHLLGQHYGTGPGPDLADFYTNNEFYGYWILIAEIVLRWRRTGLILISNPLRNNPDMACDGPFPCLHGRFPEPLGHGAPGHGRAGHAF